jgi:hypothetical protein
MFDPSLPPPFPIVEDDLVYVITGYNKINCLPDSRESSVQNLRRYVVNIVGISGAGFSLATANSLPTIYSTAQEDNLIDINYSSSYPYYQSIATTGLNARIGNNMEIQFATGTPAANKYGGVGGKYFSGIISTTGLNTKTENLIVRDFESIWPYSGIVYNTGLNARPGNLIEIQYKTSSPAGGLYGGVEGKYWSGIISTTGLNMVDGNNIAYTIDTSFPHKYTIFTVDKASRSINPMTFSNNNFNSFVTVSGFTDPNLTIDYSSLYTSKPNETIDLISTFKLLLSENNVTFNIPFISSFGDTGYNKQKEFASISGIPYTTLTDSCYQTTQTYYEGKIQKTRTICAFRYKTLTDIYNSASDLSDWETIELNILANTFNFYVSCSGGSSSEFSKFPLNFTNLGSGIADLTGGNFTFGSKFIYEKYRSSTDGSHTYTIDNIDPMTIEYFQQLLINSSSINSQNTTSPQFNISNFGYSRKYRKLIGYSDLCSGSFCDYNMVPVYRYHTAYMWGPASFSVDKRSFKTKNV